MTTNPYLDAVRVWSRDTPPPWRCTCAHLTGIYRHGRGAWQCIPDAEARAFMEANQCTTLEIARMMLWLQREFGR